MVHLTPRRGRSNETGAVALLVALMAVILFTICGFVIDLGQARVVRQHAQNAADAVALAAGNALYLNGTKTPDFVGAMQAAKSYAATNYGVTADDWATCHDPGAPADAYHPDPSISCISFDSPTAPLHTRVVMPMRNVATPFASILGVHSVDIDAGSTSALHPGGMADCGLCLIGEGEHALQNGKLTINGSNIDFNGSVTLKNQGVVVSGGDILIEGSATTDSGTWSPANPKLHQPPIDDPLAGIVLPAPTAGGAVKTNPCTQGPGTYGAFNFPNGTCTLQPGLYVITGEWSLTGTASLDASAGVTLYFTCGTAGTPVACAAPGTAGGWLDSNGNGDVKVTAPTTGSTAGLAIVYDRLNTSLLRLTGNAVSAYVGTIYAYSAQLRFTGNGCAGANQSLIVTKDLAFDGSNSCLQSTYTQSANVYVPPSQLHLSQ